MILKYIFIVFLIFSHPVKGQMLGEQNHFFIHGAPGISTFTGNLDNVNFDKPYLSYAFKGGVGFFFNYGIAAVIDYRIADYPRTDRPSVGGYTRNHTMNIYAQYNFIHWGIYEPYVLGGIGMTFFGLYDVPGTFKPAFGPVLGAGVNISLTNKVTMFFEGSVDFVLDDEAMDEKRGRMGFDVLGYFGAGIRINLRPSFINITEVRISGPRQVEAGDSFILDALLEGNPTGPVAVRWDLGDGNYAIGKTIAHVYRSSGTYTVSVTASNRRSNKVMQIDIEVR